MNVQQTDFCIFTNNTIRYGNTHGVIVTGSQYNNFTYNTFIKNDGHALSIYDFANNTIWNNNFLNNNPNSTINVITIYYKQAYDDGTNNWYNAALTLGNYWSDLLWNATSTYLLDGGSNIDLHPLEFPV
jgi:parallel beta-helix repeat protein